MPPVEDLLSKKVDIVEVPDSTSFILVSGYRDAVEHLQARYVSLCNGLHIEPIPEMFETEKVMAVMSSILEINDLMIWMGSDFNQGFMLRRLVGYLIDEKMRKLAEDDYV